ncbi:unnamed protein product [Toxocara canis]|uniref:Tight junction-associated protein 1 n=1 Tax=Toxocara canis TaxID=6265 RepID=A0A183UDB1_TOXCA|nr:unnamed protein product [Toxocara canis]
MGDEITQVVVTQNARAEQEDAAWWKAKYQRLEEQFEILKKRNEDLEERMLNLVEKVESDKIALSEEIDHLSGQLTAASNKVVCLERECDRYKKDCVLAVHLLHCKPSHYRMTTDVPEGICKEEEKPQQSTSLMRGGMVTFPPMAVYLPEAEEPEDPSPVTNALSARSDLETSAPKSPTSFTSKFLQKIATDEDYSYVGCSFRFSFPVLYG